MVRIGMRACYACGEPVPRGIPGYPTLCALCRRAHFPDEEPPQAPEPETAVDGEAPSADAETLAGAAGIEVAYVTDYNGFIRRVIQSR